MDTQNHSVFSACPELTSISVPQSVEEIASNTFEGITSLTSILVSPENKTFSSFDGMLFSKSKTKLLSVPEDKEGTALLPDALETVPVGVFSHSTQLTSLSIGDSCATYTSECGVLYTKDKKTLIAAPAGISASVVIPDTTKTIGPFAFAGTMLDAVVVLGAVTTVDTTAFNDKTKQEATVALSATESFDTARSVWEQVGFTKFKMPARPGDSTKPDADMTQQTGLTYTLLPDYTLSVIWVGTATPDKDLTIPASAMLNGVAYRVSTIEAHAFEGMPIESLTVPSSVTTIGDFAFVGCTSLTTINLSEGVTSLGDSAFERTSLERVVLPSSVKAIGSRAFGDCLHLSRIVCLAEVTSIAPDAIEGDADVSILVPDVLTSWNPGLVSSGNHIEAYGIAPDQANLELVVGESKELFEQATIKLPSDCTISYSYPASTISVDTTGIVSAKRSGVTDVVGSIVLDDVVLTQEMRTVVISDASAPKDTEASTLSSVAPLSRISLSLSDDGISLLAVNDTFAVGDYKYTILEDGTTDATRRVSIAAANTSISLKDFELPSSVTDSSTKKTYKVTEITYSGFFKCKSLVGFVRIPDSITSIKDGPFRSCEGLTAILVSPENTSFTSQDNVLYSKDLKSLIQFPAGIEDDEFVIPDSVKTINPLSFGDAKKLKSIVIPDSVTAIKKQAFIGCIRLAGVSAISSSVTSLGAGAFSYCPSLMAINVAPDNAVYVSQDGVVYKKDLTSLVGYPAGRRSAFSVPDSVTVIESLAFAGTNVSSVIIPGSVKSIVGNAAFGGCSSLTSVVLIGGQPVLQARVFMEDRVLRDIYVGYDATGYVSDAFDDIVPANIQVHLAPGLSDTVWKNAGFKVSQSPFVVFDPTGGSPMPQPQDVVSGQPTTKPETDPTKEGYVFTGWYTAPAGGTAWNFTTPVTEVTTLYAQWATARTVTFDGNGGEPATSTKVVADGTALGASGKPTDPARTGYTFSGWFDAATGGSAYNFNSSVTSDFTLYAHWKPNTYTVTYSANGASGTAPADTPATYETDFVLPDQGTLAKTGHTFVGWNTEPNGSGTTYVAGSTQKNLTSTLGGAVTLYAKWTPIIYTVTYNSTGGSTVPDTPAAYDTYLSAPESPTRQGYAFAGWYREKDLVIPWDFEVNKVTCDMTLFAKWTAIVDVDAPIDPKIEIDAQGNVITSAASTRSFVSRSPQTVAITGVSCTTTASTSLVFPNSAQWPGIKISIIEPSKPYDGAEVKLGKTTTAEFMIPKAPENSTSELSLAFGLILPSPVSISYIDQPNGVDIATLSYTFALLGGE